MTLFIIKIKPLVGGANVPKLPPVDDTELAGSVYSAVDDVISKAEADDGVTGFVVALGARVLIVVVVVVAGVGIVVGGVAELAENEAQCCQLSAGFYFRLYIIGCHSYLTCIKNIIQASKLLLAKR